MSSWTDGANLVPNSGRRNRTRICRTVVEVIRYIETTTEITGENGKNLGQEVPMPSSQSYIYIYIKFRQPVKEKILSEGTRQKAKYCNYIFSLSHSQFKERRKKEKRNKDIYIYVLSADNIADTVNICVHVYIKKPCHILISPHVEIYCVICRSSYLFHVYFQLRSPHVILT